MTDKEMDQINKWLVNEENINNLDIADKLALMQEHVNFFEAIKPIIVRNMAKDETQRFLFKL